MGWFVVGWLISKQIWTTEERRVKDKGEWGRRRGGLKGPKRAARNSKGEREGRKRVCACILLLSSDRSSSACSPLSMNMIRGTKLKCNTKTAILPCTADLINDYGISRYESRHQEIFMDVQCFNAAPEVQLYYGCHFCGYYFATVDHEYNQTGSKLCRRMKIQFLILSTKFWPDD